MPRRQNFRYWGGEIDKHRGRRDYGRLHDWWIECNGIKNTTRLNFRSITRSCDGEGKKVTVICFRREPFFERERITIPGWSCGGENMFWNYQRLRFCISVRRNPELHILLCDVGPLSGAKVSRSMGKFIEFGNVRKATKRKWYIPADYPYSLSAIKWRW